jgi:hypothetical protein
MDPERKEREVTHGLTAQVLACLAPFMDKDGRDTLQAVQAHGNYLAASDGRMAAVVALDEPAAPEGTLIPADVVKRSVAWAGKKKDAVQAMVLTPGGKVTLTLQRDKDTLVCEGDEITGEAPGIHKVFSNRNHRIEVPIGVPNILAPMVKSLQAAGASGVILTFDAIDAAYEPIGFRAVNTDGLAPAMPRLFGRIMPMRGDDIREVPAHELDYADRHQVARMPNDVFPFVGRVRGAQGALEATIREIYPTGVHVIVVLKDVDVVLEVTEVNGTRVTGKNLKTGKLWGFDATDPAIRARIVHRPKAIAEAAESTSET